MIGEDEESVDILNFDADPALSKFCDEVGLDKARSQESMIFLLRKEYQRLWSEIKARHYDGELRVVVTGTPGIGKSAFRFFVLRQRLLGDVPGFQSVVFNAGEKYYRVNQHGVVIVYDPHEELDRRSLCLLDPCAMLDRQKRLLFGLTLVTSSPSPLTKQQNKFSLSDFECYTLVMNAWTVSEIRAVYPHFEESRLINFSCQLDHGERLCVPRWIMMKKELIESEIMKAHDGTSPSALRRFLRTPKSCVRDPNLPYALCRIEYIPGTVVWAATGFISNYVTKYIYRWISEEVALDREDFNHLVQNPFSRGLFGTIFEDWVQTGLGEKNKVLEVRIGNGFRRFQFRGMQSYQWNRIRKTGKVLFPNLHLENEVFNKPEGLESPSIDGYAIHSDTLVMVQPTMSLTHSGAKLVAVEDLINAAKSKGVTSILMVYVVLDKNVQQFKVPDCKELVEAGVTICVGYITDESDLIAKFTSELC